MNIPGDTKINFKNLFEGIQTNYFGNPVSRTGKKCVKMPDNKQGMSPVDIVSIITGLLYGRFFNNGKRNTETTHNYLSPMSCKELDFWVALKRIGDFGQILQCKQLGIPLFTDDSMQILISIAACSSVVFTIDNFKVLYYKGDIDCFVCSDNTIKYKARQQQEEANLNRDFNIYRVDFMYKNIINNLIITEEVTDIDNKLKSSAKKVLSERVDLDGTIKNIRKNCNISIEQPVYQPTFSSSLSSNTLLSSSSSSSSSSLQNPYPNSFIPLNLQQQQQAIQKEQDGRRP
jgi:hypothetical protein